jgi:hypothetical protein
MVINNILRVHTLILNFRVTKLATSCQKLRLKPKSKFHGCYVYNHLSRKELSLDAGVAHLIKSGKNICAIKNRAQFPFSTLNLEL